MLIEMREKGTVAVCGIKGYIYTLCKVSEVDIVECEEHASSLYTFCLYITDLTIQGITIDQTYFWY